jgi:hypothetical protein
MLSMIARLAAVGTAGAAYVIGVRPQLRVWGASEAEASESLPGDEHVPAPRFSSTRAIDIAAAPSAVWPWLVQLGEGRAGLYSYEALERLIGADMQSSDTIVPELQDLAVDDTIRLAPIGGPDGLTLVVDQLEAPELLVLVGRRQADDGDYFSGAVAVSWTLVARAAESGVTRLISRWRMSWAPSAAADLFNGALVEPFHFALDEKLLRGIRDRAERPGVRDAGATGQR